MKRNNRNSTSSDNANIKGQAGKLREAMAAKRRGGSNGKVTYLTVTRVGSRASGNAMKVYEVDSTDDSTNNRPQPNGNKRGMCRPL